MAYSKKLKSEIAAKYFLNIRRENMDRRVKQLLAVLLTFDKTQCLL